MPLQSKNFKPMPDDARVDGSLEVHAVHFDGKADDDEPAVVEEEDELGLTVTPRALVLSISLVSRIAGKVTG
jgi:hypothetical protein